MHEEKDTVQQRQKMWLKNKGNMGDTEGSNTVSHSRQM